MGSERRKHRRFPVRIDIICKGTTQSVMGRVSNISAGGCRVASSVTLAAGDPAAFTIYFNNGTLTLPGRVVAVGTKSVSVRFENLTPSLQYQLKECLESLNIDEALPFRSGR